MNSLTLCLLLTVLSSAFILARAAPNDIWVDFNLDRNDEDTFLSGILVRESEDLSRLEKELEFEFQECEKKLNQTVDSCNDCITTQCQTPPEPEPERISKVRNLLKVPILLVKKPLEAIAKAATKLTKKAAEVLKKGITKAVRWLGKDVGRAVSRVAESIGKRVKKVVKSVGEKAVKIAKKVISTGKKIGKGIASAAKKVVSGTKKVVKSIGRSVSSAAKKVWRGFKKLFGRRRRDVSADEKACFAKCPACIIHTLSNDKEITQHVCGAGIWQKNDRMVQMSQRIVSLSNTIEANGGSIVKVQYSVTKLDHSTGISRTNKVIGKLEAGTFEYTTELPLKVSGTQAEQEQYTRGILQEFEMKWNIEFNKKYNF